MTGHRPPRDHKTFKAIKTTITSGRLFFILSKTIFFCLTFIWLQTLRRNEILSRKNIGNNF
uniref:Candidate secreted effector n=1 Tax=Meloidogyne incognita TaxID=6306 RepID=A0A914MRB1_MELIC